MSVHSFIREQIWKPHTHDETHEQRARTAFNLTGLLATARASSLDALKPRLTEKACCDDWGINIGISQGSESD